ncbi:hypothetical protein BKA70DRAFT_1420422 [Coprinopsis sp. MPI-PUGE-AT-0042]|nr:hypothetical protein BKA70DRAFT_1420422 [Coprinopsis sp. MPI-PUGE-AT-0042]
MARTKATNAKSATKSTAKKPVTKATPKKPPVKVTDKKPVAKGKGKRRASTESEDEGEEISTEGRKPAKRAKAAEKSDESDVDRDDSARPVSKNADNDANAPSDGESNATLIGTFDLYAMELAFLNKVYSPSAGGPVDPLTLYTTILTYQAKNDRTAKVTIPQDFSLGKDGKFKSAVFCDPFEEMPFDIAVTAIEQADTLKLNSKYKRPTKEAWTGPGIKASMELEDARCGIASSSGSIAFHPMWKKVGKDEKAMELFEGTLTMDIRYGSMYSRKGHGKGQNETIPFWGVRAKD